jgi:hypothetical protein
MARRERDVTFAAEELVRVLKSLPEARAARRAARSRARAPRARSRARAHRARGRPGPLRQAEYRELDFHLPRYARSERGRGADWHACIRYKPSGPQLRSARPRARGDAARARAAARPAPPAPNFACMHGRAADPRLLASVLKIAPNGLPDAHCLSAGIQLAVEQRPRPQIACPHPPTRVACSHADRTHANPRARARPRRGGRARATRACARRAREPRSIMARTGARIESPLVTLDRPRRDRRIDPMRCPRASGPRQFSVTRG